LRAALYSTTFETIAGCVVAALIVALALLLPVAGKYTALALLSVFATLYAVRIRQESAGMGADEARPLVPGAKGRLLAWASKWTWAVLLAVGCVGPLWWGLDGPLPSTIPPSRRWIPVALLAVTLWTVIPFVTYLFEAKDERERLGPRRALVAAARQPFVTVAALLAFPLAMVVAEAVLVGVLSLAGVFSPWVLDLFRYSHGVDRSELYATLPSRLGPGLGKAARSIYLEELARGSTLLAAIPLSLERLTRVYLAMQSKVSIYSWRYHVLEPTAYFLLRLAATTFIIATGMVILAAQAFWLNAIARSSPPPEGAPATEELTRAFRA
jgi:hypothetical protein